MRRAPLLSLALLGACAGTSWTIVGASRMRSTTAACEPSSGREDGFGRPARVTGSYASAS